MLELEMIDGVQTAILNGVVRFDAGNLRGTRSLWITPSDRDVEIGEPIEIPDLETLYIAGCDLPIIELVTGSSLLSLKSLNIAHSPNVFRGLRTRLDRLERLKLREQALESHDEDWICNQPSVLSLSLTETNLVDGMLLELACSESLRRLDVYRSPVTFLEPRFSHTVFPSVRSLDVSQTDIVGSSVAVIRTAFPNLERLIATKTRLGLAEVEEIARWPKLKVLATGTQLDFDHYGEEFWDL